MVRLLELVHRGEVLSETSRGAVLDILSRQQLHTIIPHDLPVGTQTAHKTGGVPGVRCDVGIVYAPSGAYAVALMAKRVTDMKAVDRALARLSRAVYDRFEG
jgi:beta-lactamase class A